MDATQYQHLKFDRQPNHVLVITIDPRDPLPGEGSAHAELARVWPSVASDDDTHVAVVTGSFQSTIDPQGMLQVARDYTAITTVLRQGLDIVHNMVNCDKPIVSAVTGPARGAGMVVALLADISIADEEAIFSDSHIQRVGVVAGDHAAMIWPLLCGLAKAKYHLFTGEPVDGREAERIGLISRAVPKGEALDAAVQIADGLATAPQLPLRWTKRALNHWLRNAGPLFESSIAFEALSVLGDDHAEALHALQEQRAPAFRSGVSW